MIQKLIDDKLKADNEKVRIKSGKFSPSKLGMCYRHQVLNRARIPVTNKPDSRGLRIFKVGNLFHDFIQGFIPNNETEVDCESTDLMGRADIVTEDTVYDIKSVHSKSFWYSKKDGYDVKKEKYNNWLQLAYYAHTLKKEKMVLVMISKDDMCIEEYTQLLKSWKDELSSETNMLSHLWLNYGKTHVGTEPLPHALPRTKWDCGYGNNPCEYLDYCKGVEKDGHRIHPTDKPKPNSKSKSKS